jgi:hypothetical protein
MSAEKAKSKNWTEDLLKAKEFFGCGTAAQASPHLAVRWPAEYDATAEARDGKKRTISFFFPK